MLANLGVDRHLQLQQITPAPSLECLVAVVAALAIAKGKEIDSSSKAKTGEGILS